MHEFDLIYIYLNASLEKNSVQDKVVAQLHAMNDGGIRAHGLFFTTDTRVKPKLPINQFFEFIHVDSNVKGWFRSIRENRLMLKAMIKYIDNHSINKVCLYTRSHRPSYAWYRLIRRYSNMLIVEHQTIEKEELRNLSSTNKIGLRPSKFLSWIEFSLVPKIQEVMWGGLSIGRCKRLVGVTEEITQYELNRAILGRPKGYTITNGIIVENYKLREPPYFNGKELHLLMLVGGTTDVDWHGIDLILQGIQKYTGTCEIKLHIAGHSNILEKYESSHLIKHGYLNKEQIDTLSDQCHLALGTFAFERKGLKEASTLKMREYAARGIPAVYGHFDFDYKELENRKLALRLDSMVPPSFDRIIEFARSVNIPGISEQIRNEAAKRMGMNAKMWALKEILVELK